MTPFLAPLTKSHCLQLQNCFHTETLNHRVRLSPSQKQKGSNDCGAFAIAIAVAVAYGLNPSKLHFKQEGMRAH